MQAYAAGAAGRRIATQFCREGATVVQQASNHAVAPLGRLLRNRLPGNAYRPNAFVSSMMSSVSRSLLGKPRGTLWLAWNDVGRGCGKPGALTNTGSAAHDRCITGDEKGLDVSLRGSSVPLAASLTISLSKDKSATTRLSRVFSVSSSFSRLNQSDNPA